MGSFVNYAPRSHSADQWIFRGVYQRNNSSPGNYYLQHIVCNTGKTFQLGPYPARSPSSQVNINCPYPSDKRARLFRWLLFDNPGFIFSSWQLCWPPGPLDNSPGSPFCVMTKHAFYSDPYLIITLTTDVFCKLYLRTLSNDPDLIPTTTYKRGVAIRSCPDVAYTWKTEVRQYEFEESLQHTFFIHKDDVSPVNSYYAWGYACTNLSPSISPPIRILFG